MIDEASVSEHVPTLKKILLQIIRRSFAEDSKLLLCFICSLGTATGLALSGTCFIWEDSSLLGLLGIGLVVTAVCFAVFLYVVWKMD